MIFLYRKIIILVLSFIVIIPAKNPMASISSGAVSAVLIETDTNTIIYEKNPHQKMPMASTTKIMTAICAIENGNPNKVVEVDIRSVGVEGSSIYLKKGEKFTLKDLVYGLMLHSGNDAAVAIACEISGSSEEFAKLMNKTAKKIGAVNTHFENPNGLDQKEHYTTAYDLAIITSYAMKNPHFAEIVSTYKTTIKNSEGTERLLKNHNKLLSTYEGCTGVKTGFTKKSGRCLVTSAKRGNTELIAVTLNDGNDWQDHTNMLNYGFENTQNHCLLKKGDYLCSVAVNKGNKPTIKAVCQDDIVITTIKGKKTKFEIEYNISGTCNAPVEYGAQLGEIVIKANGKIVAKTNAVSCEMVVTKENIIKTNFVYLVKSWFEISLDNQH